MVVALLLATSIPSYSEDGSPEVLTSASQDAGVRAMPTYDPGAGKLDGDLGRADVRVDGLTGVPFRANPRSIGRGRRRPVEPESADESASELKFTNPVSALWSLSFE